jgi:hypothetical protein
MILTKLFSLSKKFAVCPLLIAICVVGGARAAEYDSEDPLYFESGGDLTLRGGVSLGSDLFDTGLRASYGINGIFVLSADMRYQQDFDGDADGFSGVGFQIAYRASDEGRITTDILVGMNFGGSAAPEWFNNVYMAGVRIGRQWESWTLSGTAKASWIFDDEYGMSFIDLTPMVYFRMSENWRLGMDATFRKATDDEFDETWAGAKLVRQYGRTQYVGFGQYEFKEGDFRFGARVNVVF